jgi:hypothetical protein
MELINVRRKQALIGLQSFEIAIALSVTDGIYLLFVILNQD